MKSLKIQSLEFQLCSFGIKKEGFQGIKWSPFKYSRDDQVGATVKLDCSKAHTSENNKNL